MARLPVLCGQEVARTFVALGWSIARSGNHIILVKEGQAVTLSVPDHKEVDPTKLEALEYADAIFPELDYRLFAS